MPGSSYIPSAADNLSNLLNKPIPGRDSAGFDQLSNEYSSGERGGIGDIASRGLMDTGAVPDLYQNLGTGYASGAAKVVSQGEQQQQAQKKQLLDALLGLGGDATRQVQGSISSNVFGESVASGLLQGMFGANTSPGKGGGIFSGPGTGGLRGVYQQLQSHIPGLPNWP